MQSKPFPRKNRLRFIHPGRFCLLPIVTLENLFLQKYRWGQNYCIPFFVLGNYFRQLLQETLQHEISGGINVM